MHTALILGMVLLLQTYAATPAAATEDAASQSTAHIETLRKLSINRSLLSRAEAEYTMLLKEERTHASEELSQRIKDLRYKIEALREDAERLRQPLPAPKEAEVFLTDIVQRKEVTGLGEAPDTEDDRRIDDRIAQIALLHEEALLKVADRRFSEARRLYEEIILLSPDDDEAYLLMGHTALAEGRPEEAARAFANAIHIDPSNAEEMPRLYENILLENPSDSEAMTHLGYIHLFLGDGEEAARCFEDAVRADPMNAAAAAQLEKLQVVSEEPAR